MKLSKQGKTRIMLVAALAVIFALIVSLGNAISPSMDVKNVAGAAVVYADELEYYKLKAGDKDVAFFKTQEEAEEVIDLVKNKYVDAEAKNPIVTISPELTVEKITVPKNGDQPDVNSNPSKVLEDITAGDAVITTYTVKAGDTLWGIADAKNISVEDLQKANPDLDLDYIVEGEEIVISSKAPEKGLITVTVEYEESKEVTVEYETIYEEDPEMEIDAEEIVKTEGKEGKARITEKVTAVNGVVDKRTEVSKTQVVRPVNEIIVRGTKEATEEDSAEGEDDSYDEASEESEESAGYEESSETEDYVEETEETYDETSDYATQVSSEDYSEESHSKETEEYVEETYTEEVSDTYEEESTSESEGDSGTLASSAPQSSSDNQEETFRDIEEMEVPEETGEEATSDLDYSSEGGQAIVDYAMQFIGNPYVWGGTSLTNGCDCSGFIYSVFNDCGYAISRWPDSDFPHISADELQPGDICVYGHHYAIYIGGGMEISAINEAQGINTHPMYYSTSPFMYGLRIVN